MEMHRRHTLPILIPSIYFLDDIDITLTTSWVIMIFRKWSSILDLTCSRGTLKGQQWTMNRAYSIVGIIRGELIFTFRSR